MKKIALIVICSITMAIADATVPDLGAIESAFMGLQASPNSGPVTPIAITAANTSCLEQEQKTIPFSLLRSLMQNSNQEIAINHNADSGELRINLGVIVSNCDDMINYKLERRSGYTALSMEIKPATTSGGYNVRTRSGTSTPIQIKPYPQNLDGFMQCLQENTFNEGSPDRSKIIYENKTLTFNGQNQGGRVVFAEHGPQSSGLTDEISDLDACYSNSNMGGSSYSMRTREELEQERASAEFQEACRSQNSSSVIQAIERFGQNVSLLRIRDELIQSEMETMVDSIKTSSNLEEDFETSDIQNYQVLVNNFKNYILSPRLQEIYDLRAQYQRASREEKERIKAEIIAKIRELQNYIKSGMLSRDFLLHMINERKHAPTDNGEWLDLVQSITKIYFNIKNLKDLAFEDIPRSSRDIRDFNESVDDSVDEFMQAVNRQQVQTEIREINDEVTSEIQTIEREALICRNRGDQRCVDQASRDIEALTSGGRRAIRESIESLPEGRENDFLYESISAQYQLNLGMNPGMNQNMMCNEMMMMMGQCNPAMMQMQGGQMNMSAQFGGNSQLMMNPMMMGGAQAQNPYQSFTYNPGSTGAMNPNAFSLMPSAVQQQSFGQQMGGQQSPFSY